MSTNANSDVMAVLKTALDVLALDDPKLRLEARGLLAGLGSSAVPSLLELLPGSAERTRHEALRALADLRDPRAAETFVERLEDDCSDCRWAAAEGLVGLGWDGLLRVLDELAEYPGTVWKLRGLHHVLGAMRASEYCELVQPVMKAFQSDIPEIDVPRAAIHAAARMRRLPEVAI